ncbi:MAG: 2-phospho-L-lactate transferase [Promethearchaeota archaeon]|nr:MAG: 2-phospho-L-lactate transferase [Candidatus Lokiarchaeota archaeon]
MENMNNDFYLILAGGVGAAKFIEGLANVVRPESLKIIVNTGDDIELFGLNICPDLDIITYTLANLVDKEKGWGFIDESFNSLSILKKYYDIGWFNAGDKDLATHIYRTDLFKQGYTKAEITKKICEKLNVKSHIIPMCNENVETYIDTPKGEIHFEEYFIKECCEPEILNVKFKGIKNAKPVDMVLEYIKNAKKIIICPSNPIVSIGTILRVKGIKKSLIKERKKVYAISPIIKGTTVKGPADKFMRSIGLEASCVGVAQFYRDFLGNFIIDNKDCKLKPKIEELGIKTFCFDTLMTNLNKKKELAQFLINIE